MKNYINIFIGICCTASLMSCSNNMDETVFSKITEQTYNYSSKDFKPAVASVYSELRNMPSHGGYFCEQEGSSDEIVMPPNASGWDDGGYIQTNALSDMEL